MKFDKAWAEAQGLPCAVHEPAKDGYGETLVSGLFFALGRRVAPRLPGPGIYWAPVQVKTHHTAHSTTKFLAHVEADITFQMPTRWCFVTTYGSVSKGKHVSDKEAEACKAKALALFGPPPPPLRIIYD